MTREDVLEEFGSTACESECDSCDCMADQKMADEIVRLRSVLAALREPSEAVLKAAAMHYGDLRDLLIVAVAAAEQEVGQ